MRTYICDSADDGTDTVTNGRKDGTLKSRVSGTGDVVEGVCGLPW